MITLDAGTSAAQIASLVNNQAYKATDVAEYFFERARELNPVLNAFVYLDWSKVNEQAREIDLRVSRGECLPLAGVPVAIKDVISVKGYPLTCGSRILQGYIPPFDATAVKRLRQAGAVMLGMTNTDEFAMGSSTENSFYGPTNNPWAKGRVPGGSSGGSAVSVAAGLVPVALGTDTGGSVRLPAAFTGVYGFKPTYGAISRYGVVAYSNSLEQIGIFAHNINDVALVYSCISGKDEYDGTTDDFGCDIDRSFERDVSGWRAGVISETLDGVSSAVRDATEDLLDHLGHIKVISERASIPHIGQSLAAYYLIAMSEASSNLARFDGVRYGVHPSFTDDWSTEYSRVRSAFGLEVKRRIIMGAFALSKGYYDMYYERAARFRSLISAEFEAAFAKFDILVSPTSPTLPFKFGERLDDPLTMYLSDIHTVPANLAGLPALNLPLSKSSEGGETLPVGIQLIAGFGKEDKLLSVASRLERAGAIKSDVVEPWGIVQKTQ
jgi:aspartyl-tRNA(Asn)/glutamyl-tRNA(Gln) amidotransferase subunit A